MTLLQELDQEFKKLESKTPAENIYFLNLMRLLPPRPIVTAKEHEVFLEALKKISLLLNQIEHNPSLEEQRDGCAQYACVIEDLIAHYERDKFPSESTPLDTLKFLIEQHGLTQADLAEDFGGQPNVSSVLSGKRELNLTQIRRLATRFHVSPLTFLGT
jgi:antitoxin component HigA of HigAB toxin-antitoxin module